MKKYIIFSIAMLLSLEASAQGKKHDLESVEYRRSSLYSLLISHTDRTFNTEIENCFLEIPTPDTYNDHDLSVKIVNIEGDVAEEVKKKKETPKGSPDITGFLERNKIASRLIGKWFNRDFETGECDMSLIQERGLYAASEIAKAKAAASLRGNALLADAGEDLIQNTFVLVNDIMYKDKSKGSKAVGIGAKIAGLAAAIITQNSDYANLGTSVGSLAETFKGFSVIVHTSLYQLVWDEETSASFYDAWNNKGKFDRMRGDFRLKYVGDQVSSGSTTSFLGIREDEPEKMVRKACQRALDENIASLQQNFQAFQIKTPLEGVEPYEARVGKKEGITENSLFEVLEPEKKADGTIVYNKVGELKPVPNLIWDNRYMAEEEMAEGATLGRTTFKKVKGSDFQVGYLIRQIK